MRTSSCRRFRLHGKRRRTTWGVVAWTDDTRKSDYPVLSQPDGRIYLAGEHMSYINAWQAGALESARDVVRRLHARVRAA